MFTCFSRFFAILYTGFCSFVKSFYNASPNFTYFCCTKQILCTNCSGEPNRKFLCRTEPNRTSTLEFWVRPNRTEPNFWTFEFGPNRTVRQNSSAEPNRTEPNLINMISRCKRQNEFEIRLSCSSMSKWAWTRDQRSLFCNHLGRVRHGVPCTPWHRALVTGGSGGS